MDYTQIEITRDNISEVWWIPVPASNIHIGEKILREDDVIDEEWTVTQVCITLKEEEVPKYARIAHKFKRESQTIAFMSF